MGGTGKTPAIKFLLENFKAPNNAVISRGYGRKSSGYKVVEKDSDPEISGDEPLEIKQAFPASKVVVCEKRQTAVNILEKEGPQDLLLFDDLYQHRHVSTDCNILLSSFSNLFYKDFVMPAGTLREFAFNKNRSDVLLITKCPASLSKNQAQEIKNKSGVSVPVFFSGLDYENTEWRINQPYHKQVILLSSIANTVEFFQEGNNQYRVIEELKFPDHYNYTAKKVLEIIGLANKKKADIVTTAKDIVKLHKFEHLFKGVALGVIEVNMQILFNEKENFIKIINTKLKND
jgi:tetraacyldisaccharide 4'-kinase